MVNLFKDQYGDISLARIGIAGVVGILGFLILKPFVIVQPGNRVVVTRLGKVQPTTLGEGLHGKVPLIDNLTYFDTRIQKDLVEGSGFSKDVQEVNITVSVNYQLTPDKVGVVFQELKTLDNVKSRILTPAVNEEVKAALAKLDAETIIGKRKELKADIVTGVTERLEQRGLTVIAGGVNIDNIDFTDQFEASIEEKQIAEQEAKKAVYIAQRAEQEAQADINRAKGKAEAAKLEAEALKAQGGTLVLQKEALGKWNGVLPQTLITGDNDGSIPALILNQK